MISGFDSVGNRGEKMIIRFGSPMKIGKVYKRLIHDPNGKIQSVLCKIIESSDYDSWFSLCISLGHNPNKIQKFSSCDFFYKVEILD